MFEAIMTDITCMCGYKDKVLDEGTIDDKRIEEEDYNCPLCGETYPVAMLIGDL